MVGRAMRQVEVQAREVEEAEENCLVCGGVVGMEVGERVLVRSVVGWNSYVRTIVAVVGEGGRGRGEGGMNMQEEKEEGIED